VAKRERDRGGGRRTRRLIDRRTSEQTAGRAELNDEQANVVSWLRSFVRPLSLNLYTTTDAQRIDAEGPRDALGHSE